MSSRRYSIPVRSGSGPSVPSSWWVSGGPEPLSPTLSHPPVAFDPPQHCGTNHKPQISHQIMTDSCRITQTHKPHWEMNLLIHNPMMLLHLCDHPGKHTLPHLNTESFSVYTIKHENVYLVLIHNNIEQIPIVCTCVSISDFPFSFACKRKYTECFGTRAYTI